MWKKIRADSPTEKMAGMKRCVSLMIVTNTGVFYRPSCGSDISTVTPRSR